MCLLFQRQGGGPDLLPEQQSTSSGAALGAMWSWLAPGQED
jgi:hypothetical protein